MFARYKCLNWFSGFHPRLGTMQWRKSLHLLSQLSVIIALSALAVEICEVELVIRKKILSPRQLIIITLTLEFCVRLDDEWAPRRNAMGGWWCIKRGPVSLLPIIPGIVEWLWGDNIFIDYFASDICLMLIKSRFPPSTRPNPSIKLFLDWKSLDEEITINK